MDVEFLFAGIGAIILIGFMGALLFERTKVPDILILIFIGLFLGPILGTYTDFGLLQDLQFEGALTQIAPYFAALALVIILFDGGLNLNLDKTMKKLGPAILHTGIAFMGTMFVTAAICYYLLGIYNIFIGLLLGCVIGGVSSAVVIPIMAGVSAKEDTKVLLTLESVLSDVMCIVTALILIEILKGSATDTGLLIQHLLSAFVLAGFIGFLFGVLWLTVLKRLEGKPFSFMITIAALFMLYAVVEFIDVSGAVAALVFGLVLSNKEEIARMLKIKTGFVLDEHIKQFHSEVSFLVRTFFFVYLGLTFTFTITGFDYVPHSVLNMPEQILANPMYLFGLALGVILIGIFIIRYIAASVTCTVDEEVKEDKSYIYSMVPRGLAAAVLAALPFTIPEFLDSSTDYFILMSGHEEMFLNMAFMMIVLTVIVTTIAISLIERKRMKDEENGQETRETDDWANKSRTYKKHLETSQKKDWKRPKPTKERKAPRIIRKHPPPPPPEPKARKPVIIHSPRESPISKKTPHPLVKRSRDHKPAEKPKRKTK
jgi:cell volume regulation protein A